MESIAGGFGDGICRGISHYNGPRSILDLVQSIAWQAAPQANNARDPVCNSGVSVASFVPSPAFLSVSFVGLTHE